jgi:lipoprotein-anchoring transpeptidase ErfK/SrfK
MLRSIATLYVSAFAVLTAFAAPASAALPKPSKETAVHVEINRAAQRMNVYVAGKLRHTWKVSTGRKGFKTPRGAWRPTWMTKMWYSKQWYNSPMPHSVFFKDGYAIHGTGETRNLGRSASHGCVRLAPRNAARLFGLIKKHGEKQTMIVVG